MNTLTSTSTVNNYRDYVPGLGFYSLTDANIQYSKTIFSTARTHAVFLRNTKTWSSFFFFFVIWLDMLSQKLTSKMHRSSLCLRAPYITEVVWQDAILWHLWTNHLIVLKPNIWIWKLANFPAPRKHTYHTFTTVLRLQWGVYWKAVRDT